MYKICGGGFNRKYGAMFLSDTAWFFGQTYFLGDLGCDFFNGFTGRGYHGHMVFSVKMFGLLDFVNTGG